jgi:hyperosmotically inducible protein
MIFSGCVPMIIGAGAGTIGYTSTRDKSIGETMHDTSIEASIKSKLYKISPQLYSNVSVISDRGSVLLTGIVQNPQLIQQTEREAWKVRGVVTVENNISVGKEQSIADVSQDAMITSKVKGELLGKSLVRSSNYKIKTMDKIVYIMGVSRNSKERDIVLSTIQHIRGIKKVVSYITVNQK